ncbi:MAG: metal ABC transporter permease, partial [Chloroflexi bacterium]|nr:metal ABC transporter permease [Chloroflexota bacterium]
ELLVGRLLLVDASEVIKTAVICGAVGLLHLLLRRFFFSISTSREAAAQSGINVRFWDFVF